MRYIIISFLSVLKLIKTPPAPHVKLGQLAAALNGRRIRQNISRNAVNVLMPGQFVLNS